MMLLQYNGIELCCFRMMEFYHSTRCDQHGEECPDRAVRYYERSGQWGVQHPDLGSHYRIEHCPFCGDKLKQAQKATVGS